MVNQPIKLQDNASLYSGDIITINNSNPLLVEVISDSNQTIKLREITSDKYLAKHNSFGSFRNSLKFAPDFEKALTFDIKQNNESKIGFQVNDKYLELDDKKFRLSDKEKWLNIDKQQNVGNIANYSEKTGEVTFDLVKISKKFEPQVIAESVQYNDSDSPQSINFSFNESLTIEHSFTQSSKFSLEVTTKFKANVPVIESELEVKLGAEIEFSTDKVESKTKTFIAEYPVNCEPRTTTVAKAIVKKGIIMVPYSAQVIRNIDGRSYNYLLFGEYQSTNAFGFETSVKQHKVRNILIVGWTGNGKSTLANVLTDTNIFTESSGGTGQTKFFQKSNPFEWKENYYRIIDNIGFGDTRGLDKKQLLLRVGEGINAAKEGLNQVLFVFSGRFSEEQLEAYRTLKALINETGITKFTTLIRTHFTNFENEDECQQDRFNLIKETLEIANIVNSCRGIIYVDNPSLPKIRERDKENLDKLERLAFNKKTRDKSRQIVLNYLANDCNNESYKLKEWDNIVQLVDNYLQQKEQSTDSQTIEKLENSIEAKVEQSLPLSKIGYFSSFLPYFL